MIKAINAPRTTLFISRLIPIFSYSFRFIPKSSFKIFRTYSSAFFL